ncbi:hypothetical protein ABZ153_40435 [Streptomyces sp. NPDC006290]|uniref:hypothetical protein n=1 Tax=Streptomyces sp. NPDC006290 TaxID=3156745 RepID=UPI0033A016D0
MGGDAAEAGGAHTAAHALGAVEDARATTTAAFAPTAFATAGFSSAAGPTSGVLLAAATAAVVAATGFPTAASGAPTGVLLVTTAAAAFAPAATGASAVTAALFAAPAVAAALPATGTAVTGATITGSASALTATTAAFATATATAALTAAGPTSGVLLVAATAAAAAVSAATLTATAVPAAVTVLTAVVDAAVPEVTGVAATLATEATAVSPEVAEPAEPAEVATGSGTAVTKTGAAVTEAAQTAIGTAGPQAAVAEPAQTAAGTAITEPAAEPTVGAAVTEPAEVTQAAVGAALGTPTDMPPEAAEVRPVLVPESPEVTEVTESAAHVDRRLLDQPPAEQALGAGGGNVEAAGDLVTVSGERQVGRVVDGGVVTGHVVGLDIRNVMVRQRVCRAPEEQGRLGQPRVECGRAPCGAGLDAEGAELADLRGCQAESSGHLLGVTVEFGPEGRVDGKAGHGIAKGVVGHVLGSPWVCVGLLTLLSDPGGAEDPPWPAATAVFRPSPPMPARTVIRGMARPAQGREQGTLGEYASGRVGHLDRAPIGYGHR